MRLWVDTDIGENPDDAIALLCAAAHPDVDLTGVSIVGDDIERRTDVARRLVPTVRVAASSPAPRDVLGADALLLIGPWTHGAELARSNHLPERVAAMGGAFRPVFHRGEVRTIEHNVGCDPDAARALLDGQGRVLIVPLDVSSTIVCTREEELALVGMQPRLREMILRWRGFAGEIPLCLHDPLALLALLGERGIEIEERRASVSQDGLMHAHGHEHDVVVAVDRGAVVARVLELLAEHGPSA